MATRGRLVAITGATRGLGRALAMRLAEAGHTVVGCGRDAQAIAGLADRLRAPRAFSQVDIIDAEGVRRWAEGVLSEHGTPDILVNNVRLGPRDNGQSLSV